MEQQLIVKDITRYVETLLKLAPENSPQFYTIVEGGSWLDWPSQSNVKMLFIGPYIEFNPDWLDLRSSTNIFMGPLKVHALAFGHVCSMMFARWDCVNGWTQVPPLEDIVF